MSIEPVPFQLREMLGQTLRPFIAQAEQVGLELRWKIDPAVPECVIGDSTRLRQILVNLLGNAVKFTEQGTIRLNVMCVSRKNDQTELQFNVADTGIGIPAHRHASIFEPFTAARGGSKRTHSGTGLGLAICARLVELMGGKIWLESALGVGSAFYFTVLLKIRALSSP